VCFPPAGRLVHSARMGLSLSITRPLESPPRGPRSGGAPEGAPSHLPSVGVGDSEAISGQERREKRGLLLSLVFPTPWFILVNYGHIGVAATRSDTRLLQARVTAQVDTVTADKSQPQRQGVRPERHPFVRSVRRQF
jgi:hypothetical protein